MAGAGVEIRVEGGAAVAQRLKAVAAKLSTPADLYSEIGGALIASTQERFEREQAPDGSPWPKSIRAMLTGGKTLRDIGTLYRSITMQADDTGVIVGTNVLYAAVHQFGAVIRAKNKKFLAFKIGGKTILKQQVRIPARPFLGLSKADETEITQISEDFLRDELEGPNA